MGKGVLDEVFVAGGCDSHVVEMLDFNEDQLQWTKSVARVPSLRDLRFVVYQDRVVLFCVSSKTDDCTELCLTPPYTKIPEPARKYYTVIGFEHKVMIFGE